MKNKILYLFLGLVVLFTGVFFLGKKVVQSKFGSQSLQIQNFSPDEIKRLAKVYPLRSEKDVVRYFPKSDNVAVFIGDSADKSGRAMLIDTKQNVHAFAIGFGGVKRNINLPASTAAKFSNELMWREVGVFAGWVEDPAKKSRYLVLADGKTADKFLIRVAREKTDCPALNSDRGLTELVVQNLDYTAERGVFDDLGPVSGWQDNDLAKVLKPRDIVVIYNMTFSTKKMRQMYGDRVEQSLVDGAGALCAESVVIQRFGGKKTIEKEIGRKIDVSPSPQFGRVFLHYVDPRLFPVACLLVADLME